MKQMGIVIFFDPSMLHFTKDVEDFSQFLLELQARNPKIKDLKSIGVDMEAAIFNGFKIHNPNLGHLICVDHLKKRQRKSFEDIGKKTIKQLLKKIQKGNPKRNSIYRENERTYMSMV